jgi:hypothetical protein
VRCIYLLIGEHAANISDYLYLHIPAKQIPAKQKDLDVFDQGLSLEAVSIAIGTNAVEALQSPPLSVSGRDSRPSCLTFQIIHISILSNKKTSMFPSRSFL